MLTHTTPQNQDTQASATQGIYPNRDLTSAGECKNGLEVWQGEESVDQHVHFICFDRTTGTLDLGGNTPATWEGILYTPNTQAALHGNSGGQSIPFVHGQLVADTLAVNGTDTLSLVYRPCDEENVCASGPGTQLIQ
jgi:hypothetical protein